MGAGARLTMMAGTGGLEEPSLLLLVPSCGCRKSHRDCKLVRSGGNVLRSWLEGGGAGSHPGLEQPLPLRHGLLQELLHSGDVWVEGPAAGSREQRQAVRGAPSPPPISPPSP